MEIILSYLTFSNIIIVLFLIILLFTIYGLYKKNNDDHDIWEWKQLVSEADGKASQTKLMQLIGSITGTFIVIYQTLKNDLSGEIFIAYLAALGLSAGFSRWLNKQPNSRYSDNERYSRNRHDNYQDDYEVSDEDIEDFKETNRRTNNN